MYEDNLPRVARVEVEIRKAKRYDIWMGSRGEGRSKEKKRIRIFYLKIEIRGLTRFEERYNNRSPATAPESLLGILMMRIRSASARIPS